MKIFILTTILLTGCSTLTGDQIFDAMGTGLSNGLKNSQGYDNGQAMRNSQAWTDSQMRAMQASQCGYGGPCPTVNVRILH